MKQSNALCMMCDKPQEADLIWHHEPLRPNDWALLYREFMLSEVPECVEAVVAVDTKYWLHVNGKVAVHEGGLNRESLPGMGYCDVVDLTPFLKTGTNVISVLAWYWGNGAASHPTLHPVGNTHVQVNRESHR